MTRRKITIGCDPSLNGQRRFFFFRAHNRATFKIICMFLLKSFLFFSPVIWRNVIQSVLLQMLFQACIRGPQNTFKLDAASLAPKKQQRSFYLPRKIAEQIAKTGELEACNDELCPYHVGGINYAPFAAFGGEERVKRLFQSIRRKARSRIRYGQFKPCCPNKMRANCDLTASTTGS